MPHLLKHLALALTLIFLVGCAATVTQRPISSSSPAAAPQAQTPAGTLVAVVTGSPAVQGSSDWSAFLEEWKASLTASAAAANVPFRFVNSEEAVPPDASTLVRLTVNNFRYVSTAQHLLLGIMVGNAYMTVDAEYLELPEKKPFGAKRFSTSSSAWEGIFSAVTPKQVQTVSEMIVKEISSTASAK